MYLSFRIKETFRKETRRGATVAKVAFLVGILFLAGGLFYFFANTFTNITEPSPTATPTPSVSPTPTSTSPTPTVSPTPTPSQTPVLTFSVSAPSQVSMNSELSISFTISNPTAFTANNVYIETSGLFSDFALQSSTHQATGSVINIGEVASGVTVVNVELTAPNRAGTYEYATVLNFQEMENPLTRSLTISVRGN